MTEPLTTFLKEKITEIETGNSGVAASMARLAKGGEPPHDSGMDARVSVLESEVKHIREDLGEIKSTLGQIAGKLSELPTKRDLSSWTWQFVAVGAGVIAIVVGGIIGGLSWIQPEPAKEIVREIQVPAAAPPQIIYIQPTPTPQPPAE